MQAQEERTSQTITFLWNKLQTGANLMKNFIKDGKIERAQHHHAIIHSHFEVTALLWLQATESANRELNQHTCTLVTSKLDGRLPMELHDRQLVGVSTKNSVPLISIAVS